MKIKIYVVIRKMFSKTSICTFQDKECFIKTGTQYLLYSYIALLMLYPLPLSITLKLS